jgi:hypothetical protein
MSTPRTTTASPLAFAREALAAATAALPTYGSARSRHTYTLPQHVAALALKQFLRTDYRGLVAYLNDWAELRHALGLKTVPHFTTLQKAHTRLKKNTSTRS